MRTENDLIQKLMVSKKIMDKHNEIPRGQSSEYSSTITTPTLENYEAPKAVYNIPEDYVPNEIPQTTNNVITEEKIKNSRLPDEIKRLMIEHPISQPNNLTSPTLSNELVEKASRLMGTNKKSLNEEKQLKRTLSQTLETQQINKSEIANIVRETVEEVLRENGLLIESTQKTKDNFTFKVGQHIFEGKLTKIKKVS